MNGIRIPDIVVTSVCACLAMGQGRPAVDPQIGVRDGFELTIAVADIPRARFMAFGPDGTLFVSLPDAGQIKACRDESGDGLYEKTATFVKGHPTVQGLFWHDGWLWCSESGATSSRLNIAAMPSLLITAPGTVRRKRAIVSHASGSTTADLTAN